MTQPLPYLAIGDDIDTIVLSSGTTTPSDFTLNRRFWAPAVTARRPSRLGGQGSYEDVIEEIDLNVRGASTPAQLYANIERLNQLLDRAQQWLTHPFSNPVTMFYAPQGSTVTFVSGPLRAIVLGRVPGDSPIALPPTFTEAGMTNIVAKLRLRFVRRGRFGFRQVDTASLGNIGTSSAAANPTVHTATFSAGNTRTYTPAKININVQQPNTMATIGAGVIVTTSGTSSANYPPDIEEAEGSSPGTGYSVVADGANNARGGNVLRFTPTTTAQFTSNWLTTVTMPNNPGGPTAVLLAVRNNSASRTFWLRVEIRDPADNIVATPMIQVPAGTSPQILRMGIVTLLNAPSRGGGIGVARVVCQADSTSGSPTLDIDYICTVPLFDSTCRVIQHDAMASGSVANPSLCVVYEEVLFRYPRIGGHPFASSIAVTYPASYFDTIDIETYGDRINVAWLATRANYWRYSNLAGTVVNTQLLATRAVSYLGPQ